jgi:hypothetical protein
MAHVSRRTLLSGAFATTALGAIGAGASVAPAQAAVSYGPRSISHVGDYGNPPSHLNYRMWNFSSSTTLSAALDKMGSNDCLVLPERSEPYYIDTSRGFAYPGTSRAMARAKGGIYGLGPNAVIRYGSSGFSAGRASGGSGNINRILESYTAGAYFGNFTMVGRDLGGCGFDGIKVVGNDTLMENLRLVGAHRGWQNWPPGETGGINGYKGSGLTIKNTEIDCRDSSGRRVGTSPMMFNQQSNVTVQDVWAHHSVSGAVTGWRVTNPILRRTRSEYNGSGPRGLNGNAFNFEQCVGTVLLDGCTFICDYGTNTGVHLASGSYFANPARLRVVNPKHDAGPYRGPLALHISKVYGGRTQTVTPGHFTVVDSAGARLPSRCNLPG